MKTSLESIEINPSHKEIGTVILLHGLGADGHDFVPMVKELRLPDALSLRFVFPHAPLRPVTINNGYVMRAWYDIYAMNIDQRADETGVAESTMLIEKLIAKEMERGIPANKIVLAGFSQGAVIALSAGLLYKKSLAGILALSGYLPHADKVMANAAAENFTVPIFVGHGTKDNVVPFALGQKITDVLQKNKYLVKMRSYDMAHSVCAEEIGDIAEWLREVYQ